MARNASSLSREAQAHNRMQNETTQVQMGKSALEADISLAGIGLALAFALCLVFGVGAMLLVGTGHETAGTIFGVGDLVRLAAVFITNTRRPQASQPGLGQKPVGQPGDILSGTNDK